MNMKNTKQLVLILVLAAVAIAPFAGLSRSNAAESWPTYAIRGAKIYTLAGAPIDNGTIVIKDGKIASVGSSVSVPAGAQTIDAKGLEVYPGMFSAATQMGINEIGAISAGVDTTELGDYKPQLVAMTAVNPESAHIAVTRAIGITHVITMPSGGVIAGQASVMYLSGWTVDELQLKRHAAMVVDWPSLGGGGGGRGGGGGGFGGAARPYADRKQEYDNRVAEISDWLDRARHYAQAIEKGKPANFRRDLQLEALVPVVKGEEPVLIIARLARDITNAVEFCDKQKIRPIIAEATEAWKVKDLLKQKNVPVILPSTLTVTTGEDEPYDRAFTQPGELVTAGVKIAFGAFSNEFARRLPEEAGVAVAYGLSHDEALKAVTINPAQIFGLDKELGTIEAGKIANLMITTGDPLELKTEVKFLFIHGRLTSLDNRHKQLYDEWKKRP
jgi:imidazolonepropionase-like amidohydrolase